MSPSSVKRPSHGKLKLAISYWQTQVDVCERPGGGGGGYSQKNWVGGCGPLPKTHILFMTKICDIPYPIYDLTKNSKPNL